MLAIACHEGRPPADDIFAHSGCPRPVPGRSPWSMQTCWTRCSAPGCTRGPCQAGRLAGHRRRRQGRARRNAPQLKKLPWASVPAVSSAGTGHGRRARRTIKVALAPAWVDFAGAAQVAQVRRTVTKKGKKTVEVVYLITSDRTTDPATLAAWVRGHWEIENKFHWVRDVTYQEDKSLVRTGNAPASWRRCGAWPSACCAWTATPRAAPACAAGLATLRRTTGNWGRSRPY